MATQFDLTPQSPHPSQTRSLIKARLAGSGKPPFMPAPFFAAQVWSNQQGHARRFPVR